MNIHAQEGETEYLSIVQWYGMKRIGNMALIIYQSIAPFVYSLL